MFCGYCCLSVLVFWVLLLSLEWHWKDGVFPSYRGSGGAGEAKRLSGRSLCIRVLPQHPREIQHHHYVGGTPHSKEVSLQLELPLLWRCARPRAGSLWSLSGLQEGKRSALLKTCSSFPRPHQQLTDIWPVLKSSRKSLVLAALLYIKCWWFGADGRWGSPKEQ